MFGSCAMKVDIDEEPSGLEAQRQIVAPNGNICLENQLAVVAYERMISKPCQGERVDVWNEAFFPRFQTPNPFFGSKRLPSEKVLQRRTVLAQAHSNRSFCWREVKIEPAAGTRAVPAAGSIAENPVKGRLHTY